MTDYMDKNQLKKNIEVGFLAFLLVLGIYYIFLASGTQLLGEDETEYYTTAQNFAQGVYTPTRPNGEPFIISIFISLATTPFFLVFGPSLGLMKAVVALFGVLTLFIVFLIGKKINLYYGIFASCLLLSISTFTHFMMMAYTEIPIAFFASLLIYCFLDLNTNKKAILTGAILSLAFYTKTSALILVAVPLLYGLFLLVYEKNRNYIKFAVIAVFMFLLLIMPLAIRNILLFGYPFIEGLNIFFGGPPASMQWPGWMSEAFKTVSSVNPGLQTYVSTFGWLAFALAVFGSVWAATKIKEPGNERDVLLITLLMVGVFIIVFNMVYMWGGLPLESRYLSIIFPALALIGGFFLWKMSEWKKWSAAIIILILAFSVFTSISTAVTTHDSQRYPADYISALRWIKSNTPSDAFIFTTYGGSLKYFGERNNIWAFEMHDAGYQFPEVMTTSNGDEISSTLKHYNITYILIWRNTVAQNYIIPQSNLWGVFTSNFVSVVANDQNHFEQVFSNTNNWVFKLK